MLLVCRLPAGHLRLQSGSKQKNLAAVLQLPRVPLPGPDGGAASPMPLAVIVDDRVEVRPSSAAAVSSRHNLQLLARAASKRASFR